MTKRTRRAAGVPLLGIGAAICVGAAVWFLFGDQIQERLSRQPFDSAAWKAEHYFTNSVRIRMVDDLLHRHRFTGMTREAVVGIVGEPDETVYFRDWDMVYWLGLERGFISIDSEWLVFRLDGEKRVTDYRIVRD